MQNRVSFRTARAQRALLFAVWCLLSALAAEAQRHSQSPSYPHERDKTLLVVEGRITRTLHLSATDLRALPRNSIDVTQSAGQTRRYEGVLLRDILRKAGARMDGQDEEEARTCVQAISGKGRSVVFSLAELDPALMESNILVADSINGSPVSDTGLILVTATDKLPLRSIDHLIIINVRRLR